MKYSVIIPTYNGVHLLTECLPRVKKHTEDVEIIVVDNGSTDGSIAYLTQFNDITTVLLSENRGFAGAINAGIKASKGEFIIILNNDVLVTPDWAVQMFSTMRRYEKSSGLRIGLVGPATNFCGGRQNVPGVQYNINQLDSFAKQFHKNHIKQIDQAGFLSGFCMMFKRAVIDDIGLFEERFFPGGYEDNDFILRANAAGWYAVIDGTTFVHHHGSRTFDTEEFSDAKRGLANRNTFLDKWADDMDRPMKLVAVYRVKGPDPYFEESLAQTSTFADAICVLVDNPDEADDSEFIAQKYPKVVDIHISHKPFDERRDRNTLLRMAYEQGADWIISIDDDEVFEDSFTREVVERLMRPVNPHIKMYGFHWRTFFNGTDRFRTDGIFGKMTGFRMIKVEPNRWISLGTEKGLHCGNIPLHPMECARWTQYRIKHYGYCSEDKCRRKYDFYEDIDDEKVAGLIGSENYSHLIQRKMITFPWIENDSLSLVMSVHNGGDQLYELLDAMSPFVDEIVIGDNESTDDTRRTAERYGARIVPVKFNDDFSALKNAVIEKATGDWILLMDSDENFEFNEIPNIRRMMDNDTDGYMFSVYNYHPGGEKSLSEAVRLFRNIPEMRYTGRVHENFDEAMQAGKVQILSTELILHHHGFMSSNERMDKKLDLYQKLNQMQLQENPQDARAAFNLALHHTNEGNYITGMNLLKYSVSLNSKFYQAHKELGLCHIRLGQRWIDNAIQILRPDHPMHGMLCHLQDSINAVIGENDVVIGSRGK